MNKKNGINKLTEAQEQARMSVVDAELRARYWKALYEVKMYTIQADKLEQEYQEVMERQRAEDLRVREMLRKQMEENIKQGVEIETPEEIFAENEQQG